MSIAHKYSYQNNNGFLAESSIGALLLPQYIVLSTKLFGMV